MKRLARANRLLAQRLGRGGHLLWENLATIWLLILSVALAVAVGQVVSVTHSNTRLTASNRALITEQAKLRKDADQQQRRSLYVACLQTDKLKQGLVVILRRSLQTLPASSYYREHPAELPAAVASSREAIRGVAPVPGQCAKLAHYTPPKQKKEGGK